MTQIPVPLSDYIPDIPPALEQIVAKVLAKEPSRRYRTADQLGRVLETFGTGEADAVSTPISVPVSAPISQPAHKTSDYTPEADMPADHQHSSLVEDAPVFAYETDSPFSDIDWVSVGLGLLALILAGGLIPFWMWVYFTYNPPMG